MSEESCRPLCVMVITEHKLSDQTVNFLVSININYKSISKLEDTDTNKQTRGKAGVALLIKKTLMSNVSEINTESNRIVDMNNTRRRYYCIGCLYAK